MTRARVSVLIYLALAACGPTDNDPGPGGVNVEDARALDEAAAKLDTKSKTQSDKAPSE